MFNNFMFSVGIGQKNIASAVKSIAVVSIAALVFQAAGLGILISLESSFARANAEGEFCAADTDVVLVMDRSGSMEEGEAPSQCDWWEIRTNKWISNTDYDVTAEWCAAKNLPAPRS